MTCPLCSHPNRKDIDKTLRQRTMVMASGGKSTVQSFTELADAFNMKAGFMPSVTGDELKRHLPCPPQETAIVTIQDALPGGIESYVMVDGEQLPVYTPGEMINRLKAIGMNNVAEHPEQVKIQHIIALMKLTGDASRTDDIVDFVRNLLTAPQGAPWGPQAPPQVVQAPPKMIDG